MFVIAVNEDIEVANASFPETVGTIPLLKIFVDSRGEPIGEKIISSADERGEWVEYHWVNNDERRYEERRRVYVVRNGNYIFGAALEQSKKSYKKSHKR